MSPRPMRTWALRSTSAVVALATVLGTTACAADAPATAPAHVARAQLAAGPVVVPALTRDVPLARDSSVSALIGPRGGSFAIPGLGLRVVVPEGAVGGATRFTATARAGAIVAYDFGPSGSTFAVPLRVTQDLRGTSWWRLDSPEALEGAYYADDARLFDNEGTAAVSEFVATATESNRARVTLFVSHFSGYIIATGRGKKP